jgi:hypothetical protein
MKKLSEIYKELGIAFTFPIEIKDSNNNKTYYEASKGFWYKHEYDSNGKLSYHENIYGDKVGRPVQIKTCEGKVIEIDGIKYELKLK